MYILQQKNPVNIFTRTSLSTSLKKISCTSLKQETACEQLKNKKNPMYIFTIRNSLCTRRRLYTFYKKDTVYIFGVRNKQCTSLQKETAFFTKNGTSTFLQESACVHL